MFSNEKATDFEQDHKAKSGKPKEKDIDLTYYETRMEKVKKAQKCWIRQFTKFSVKNILQKETDAEYERVLREYTTETLEKTESVLSSFEFKSERRIGQKTFFAKILLRNHEMWGKALFSGNVDIKTKKHGDGFLITSDGNKFIGNWVEDCFSGFGRAIDNKGNLFEGNFLNYKLHGNGKMVSFEKDYCYVGNWVEGKREGKGREETNEYWYEGDFLENKKEGVGKHFFKFLDETYHGEFKDDEINGTGVYKCNNNDTFTGDFWKGKMHGKGIYKWHDGSEYKGDYVNNVKEGFGEYKMQNSKIYRGPFVDGKPHGKGSVESDGKVQDVEFHEGKIKKNPKNNKKKKQ
jgi:hypothetical protein